jgi:hypothetical protein
MSQTALGGQPPHIEANNDPNVPQTDAKVFEKVTGILSSLEKAAEDGAKALEGITGDPSAASLRSLVNHIKNVCAQERNEHTLR